MSPPVLSAKKAGCSGSTSCHPPDATVHPLYVDEYSSRLENIPMRKKSPVRDTPPLPKITTGYAYQLLLTNMKCYIPTQTDQMPLRSRYLPPQRYPST